ncbi:hypothetical protein C8Q80DRAFT_1145724 [Daedaleopsis nitida]|nr:hypothetical protein C8Q80DRAFT_1145724 [Daedaleopsis nitida]
MDKSNRDCRTVTGVHIPRDGVVCGANDGESALNGGGPFTPTISKKIGPTDRPSGPPSVASPAPTPPPTETAQSGTSTTEVDTPAPPTGTNSGTISVSKSTTATSSVQVVTPGKIASTSTMVNPPSSTRTPNPPLSGPADSTASEVISSAITTSQSSVITGTPSPLPRTPGAANPRDNLVGVAVGACILLLLLSSAAAWLYRRCRRRQHIAKLPRSEDVFCTQDAEESLPPYSPASLRSQEMDVKQRRMSEKSGLAPSLPEYGYTAHEPQVLPCPVSDLGHEEDAAVSTTCLIDCTAPVVLTPSRHVEEEASDPS